MTKGIYCIGNTVNNQLYIGQTVDFYIRKQKHFSLLRHHKHPNEHLQNSFNKYGERSFIFMELENVDDLTKLNELEKWWIDLSKNLGYKLYNQQDITDISYRHSDKTKEKLRKASSKPVMQIDKKTNKIINIWPSATIAANSLGAKQQNISFACNDLNRTCLGFKWKYIEGKGD